MPCNVSLQFALILLRICCIILALLILAIIGIIAIVVLVVRGSKAKPSDVEPGVVTVVHPEINVSYCSWFIFTFLGRPEVQSWQAA